MSAEELAQYSKALEALSETVKNGGPYLVIVVLSWAYWQKDRELQKLNASILTSSVKNVETFGSFRAAFESLAAVIKSLAER